MSKHKIGDLVFGYDEGLGYIKSFSENSPIYPYKIYFFNWDVEYSMSEATVTALKQQLEEQNAR
jgi:hypothetical protein